MKRKKEFKYLEVAEGIEQLIAQNILHIGDKLPSVRILCEERGISLSTAFQAYYHLESKGLIEARPKSGYYVRFTHKRLPGLPSIPALLTPEAEGAVAKEDTAVFLKKITDTVHNFATTTPGIDLLPLAKLNKSVIHALRTTAVQCVAYEEPQGNAELRKQISKLALNWNVKTKPDDVVVTSGCLEALSICLQAVTRYGDAVAIECPIYFGIYQLIESLGLKAIEIPTDPAVGVHLDYLEKAIQQYDIKTCLFVTNYNNPSGSCMPDAHKQSLVALINQYRITLIEDDLYGDLYFGKQRPKTCKSYDTEGVVLYCSSFSKSLAPGYRIGWCIPGKYLKAVKEKKLIANLATASLQQLAVAHFLSIGRYEYHLKNLRKALHTQCLRYSQAIVEFFPATVKISRPNGGMVLWIELDARIDTYQLYEEARKIHISIVPGELFSRQQCFKNYFRLAFGKPYDPKIEQGLKQLGDLIKKLTP